MRNATSLCRTYAQGWESQGIFEDIAPRVRDVQFASIRDSALAIDVLSASSDFERLASLCVSPVVLARQLLVLWAAMLDVPTGSSVADLVEAAFKA